MACPLTLGESLQGTDGGTKIDPWVGLRVPGLKLKTHYVANVDVADGQYAVRGRAAHAAPAREYHAGARKPLRSR